MAITVANKMVTTASDCFDDTDANIGIVSVNGR